MSDSVPEFVKRTRSPHGTSDWIRSAHSTWSGMVVPEVGAERRRLDDGLDDGGMRVAEQERAVPDVVVDVPVAVDVPLVGALGARDVGGERQRVPHVVAERAPDRLLGPRVPRPRSRPRRLELFLEAPLS